MKAVWSPALRETKNHTLAFVYEWKAEKGDTLSLAAASLYRLLVNGKFIGYGPARGPHGYSRIDHCDLSGFAGQQVRLVVEVFASNINTFYIVDELPFFAAELARNDQKFAEASDFSAYLVTDRVSQVQRFSFQRSFVESYRMESCRSLFWKGESEQFSKIETETVTANRFLERGVSYPTLEYLPAQKIQQGLLQVDSSAEPMRDRSLVNISDMLRGFPYDELEECLSDEVTGFYFEGQPQGTDEMAAGSYQLFDFGHTCTGFFSLDAEVTQSATVYLIFDEVAEITEQGSRIDPFRNTCCNVIKYHLQPGRYSLLSFEANSARFVSVVVTNGSLNLCRMGMVLYQNPDTENFSQYTGDAQLDKIIEAARHTFAQNAVDLLTDCPSRERAGWLCDSYFSSRAEALFTGKNLVEHNFLENYILSPQLSALPKGMLPMCYPADHDDGVYIPNWSMWFVLELYQYTLRTGSDELAKAAENRVADLIRFFEGYENEDGLLENLESWVFVEWSKCNDPDYICGVNYPTNMLYAAMLRDAGKLYQNEGWIAKAKALEKEITAQSFNGTFFEDNRIRQDGHLVPTGHTTETCQYYAFYFGTASREDYPELYNTLMTRFGPNRDADREYKDVYPSNAFVGNYLRLELLLQDGEYRQVLAECRAFFTQMAELTGTLWEHSRLNASLDHGFASVAANYILESTSHLKM